MPLATDQHHDLIPEETSEPHPMDGSQAWIGALLMLASGSLTLWGLWRLGCYMMGL